MRAEQPFERDDLEALDELLRSAHAVVAMREVFAGNRNRDVIAMRHDVDANVGAFDTALRMAEWEEERGYRSSYYLLHTAPYWGRESFARDVQKLALLGHEVGIHTNALAEGLRTGGDPHAILAKAINELRLTGVSITGVVGHGDPICRDADFANDEQFAECDRNHAEGPRRTLHDQRSKRSLTIAPEPLRTFGLTYEAVRLGRAATQTDSGGRWYYPWESTVAWFESNRSIGASQAHESTWGQLHMLVHPDWWSKAFG